jgi:hypothetical protein
MKSFARFAVLLSALLLFVSCAKKDPAKEITDILNAHANVSVNKFILDKFKDYRIIMIADAGHSEGIYLRTISSFLNGWFDAAINNGTPVRNLVLIREDDSLHIQDIKKYMISHDYRDLIGNRPLDYYSWMSTADLEFYWTLGDLAKRIDQANAKGANVKLDILGPEMVPNLDDWSIAKRDEWFVNSRDTISSNAVIRYLKANPDTKALIFYGSAHIAKSKVRKPVNAGSSEGFYMAHYLYQEFGDQFFEIDQYGPSLREGPIVTGPLVTPGSPYILEQKYYNEITSLQNTPCPGPRSVDATIMIIGEVEPIVSWPFIKSKNLGWLALEEIKTLIQQNKLFHLNMGVEAASYLSMLTGDMRYIANRKDTTIIYECIATWERWLNDPDNDVVKEIVAEAPARHLLTLMKSAGDKDTEVESELLFTLSTGLLNTYDARMVPVLRKTISAQYDNEVDWPSRFEYNQLRLVKQSNRIIVTDLVQLLWVGTDQEKQEAVAELQKRTGRALTTPPEWMKWWREDYWRL